MLNREGKASRKRKELRKREGIKGRRGGKAPDVVTRWDALTLILSDPSLILTLTLDTGTLTIPTVFLADSISISISILSVTQPTTSYLVFPVPPWQPISTATEIISLVSLPLQEEG
jgi:hypothetical protein